MTLTEEAASADEGVPTDDERWQQYLIDVGADGASLPQVVRVRSLWDDLAQVFGATLMPPQAIEVDEGTLELSWTFPTLTVCIEIDRGGRLFWWALRLEVPEHQAYSSGHTRTLPQCKKLLAEGLAETWYEALGADRIRRAVQELVT